MSEPELRFWLVDVVEHRKAHLFTFELPDEWNRTSVKVGEWAKLIFAFPTQLEHSFERMWVKVVDATPILYRGVLDNEPATSGFIALGHRLSFEPRHIISIWPPRMYFESLSPAQ